jgi:hypothetical protein
VDIEGNGGQVYRLYQAVFGRTSDKQGLGFWMNAMDKGIILEAVANEFAKSNEFRTIYGSAPSSEAVATRLYENVLHRQPDQSGFHFWNNHLKANPSLIEAILVEFSESPETKRRSQRLSGSVSSINLGHNRAWRKPTAGRYLYAIEQSMAST